MWVFAAEAEGFVHVGVLVFRFVNQVGSWSSHNCRKFMWGATTELWLESYSRISQSEESINPFIFALSVKGGSHWANGEFGMEFFHSDNWDCWDRSVWVAMSPTSSLFSPQPVTGCWYQSVQTAVAHHYSGHHSRCTSVRDTWTHGGRDSARFCCLPVSLSHSDVRLFHTFNV